MSQPQWDPQTRRWYFPEGEGPPPPGPAHGRATPPGHRQGFATQQPGYDPPPHGGRSRPEAASVDQPTVRTGPRPGGTATEFGAAGHRPGQTSAPTAAPPPPLPRTAGQKKRKWPWIVGGIVVLVILIAALGGGGGDGDTTPTQAAAPAPSSAPAAPAGDDSGQGEEAPSQSGVVYEVVGAGKAENVTYGSNGGVSQETGVSLPWTKSAKAADESFAVYALSAQNSDGGEITCRITVDGKQIAEQTSSGQYAVVSCSGSSSAFG